MVLTACKQYHVLAKSIDEGEWSGMRCDVQVNPGLELLAVLLPSGTVESSSDI
jgi:hypothetical protein